MTMTATPWADINLVTRALSEVAECGESGLINKKIFAATASASTRLCTAPIAKQTQSSPESLP